jgi:hypothetical protein
MNLDDCLNSYLPEQHKTCFSKLHPYVFSFKLKRVRQQHNTIVFGLYVCLILLVTSVVDPNRK